MLRLLTAVFLLLVPAAAFLTTANAQPTPADELQFGSSKCGGCPCGTPCPSSPPPISYPSPPPPPPTPQLPPPTPKSPPSSPYCPPPPPPSTPSNVPSGPIYPSSPNSPSSVYYTGTPGQLYPIDQSSAAAVNLGMMLLAAVGLTIPMILDFWVGA